MRKTQNLPHTDRISLRRAEFSDLEIIATIFEQARAHQRSLGFRQWDDDYPAPDLIAEDIRLRRGFIIEHDGVTAGYCVIAIGCDPEYDRLSHMWHLSGPYAALHRLAIADRFRGLHLGHAVILRAENIAAENGAENIRVDTGTQNIPMQRLMESCGYINRQCHRFIWGERIAYEKPISCKNHPKH